jgi:hypothetical protein
MLLCSYAVLYVSVCVSLYDFADTLLLSLLLQS